MTTIRDAAMHGNEQQWAAALHRNHLAGAHEVRAGQVALPATPPVDQPAAYRIQRAFQQSIGSRGGWKVGAASPDAPPLRAPLPQPWIQHGRGQLSVDACWPGGLEAEIAFRVGKDLPVEQGPYTREQVIASLETAHASIEILGTRQPAPDQAEPLAKLADLLFNGCLIVGPGTPDWREHTLADLAISVLVDGEPIIRQHGGNPAGDPLRLVHWLANHLDPADGGLVAGDLITTGSWIGVHLPSGPGTVRVELTDIGDVELVLTSHAD